MRPEAGVEQPAAGSRIAPRRVRAHAGDAHLQLADKIAQDVRIRQLFQRAHEQRRGYAHQRVQPKQCQLQGRAQVNTRNEGWAARGGPMHKGCGAQAAAHLVSSCCGSRHDDGGGGYNLSVAHLQNGQPGAQAWVTTTRPHRAGATVARHSALTRRASARAVTVSWEEGKEKPADRRCRGGRGYTITDTCVCAPLTAHTHTRTVCANESPTQCKPAR